MVVHRTTTYRYRIAFNAPLPFVFRWCTDYQPSDARLEHESFRRKILERSRRKVVYEDIEEIAGGWSWRRHVVTLGPPNRWHSESIGNYRDIELDYVLRELPGGRTEMKFLGRRRPVLLGGANPTAQEFGKSMEASWHLFRKHLERDYRRSLRGPRKPRGSRARPR
jgi:hypothetical protein